SLIEARRATDGTSQSSTCADGPALGAKFRYTAVFENSPPSPVNNGNSVLLRVTNDGVTGCMACPAHCCKIDGATMSARILLPLAAGALPALAQRASPASLTIHADRPGPQVNRQLFGQFAEHLGAGIYGGIWVGEDSKIPNTRGYRNDVLQALRDLKVPVVRWPGGCFADAYNW